MKKNVLFGLFIVLSYLSLAQDKILLMNGDLLEVKILEMDTAFIQCQTLKKGKVKDTEIDIYRVYSILYEDGKEKVIYTPDSSDENSYSQKEMKYFIFGENDAEKYYKTPISLLVGFAVGSVSGYFFSASPLLALPVPLITAAVVGAIPGKIKVSNIENNNYLNEEPYHAGYKRIVKIKKTQRTLLSGVVGTVVGIAIGASL